MGRHITEQVLQRGDRVVGTVRKPEAVADLVEQYPETFCMELLDVRDAEKTGEIVNRTVTALGRINSRSFRPVVVACSCELLYALIRAAVADRQFPVTDFFVSSAE